MGISYNSQERVFRLDTAHTTYLIGIAGEEGFLGHVYYGPQLPDDNMQYLMRLDEPPLLPECNSRERASFYGSFPFEYPSAGGGDFRERLILNPNLHLTEEGKEQAMERIRQIQLAAQGDQRDQLLLERALRLYTQTIGQGREMAASLISYWKNLMDCGDRIQRRRDYDRIKEQLDMLEAAVEADPLEGGVWFGEPEEDEGFDVEWED